MVDAHAYYFCQNTVAPKLSENILQEAKKQDEQNDDVEDDLMEDEDDENDSGEDTPPESEGSEDKSKRNENLKPLTDDECMLAVPRVKGFDLQEKEWCKFCDTKVLKSIYSQVLRFGQRGRYSRSRVE